MSAIANEITKIKSSLPATTRLIAVSKTKPVEDLQQATMPVSVCLAKTRRWKCAINTRCCQTTYNGIL